MTQTSRPTKLPKNVIAAETRALGGDKIHITSEGLRGLSKHLAETDQMAQYRQSGLAELQAAIWPGEMDEHWRYTGADMFPFTELHVGESNGQVIADGDGSGYVATPFAQLPPATLERLQRECDSVDHNGPLAAVLGLHRALCGSGVHIKFEKSSTAPVVIRHEFGGKGHIPRVVVEVARGVQAILVHDLRGSGDTIPTGFVFPVLDVILGQGSLVQYVEIQDLPTDIHFFQRVRIKAERDAKFHGIQAHFGGKVSRIELDMIMAGQNVDSELLGVFITDGRQHFDVHSCQDHLIGNCRSNLYWKGALGGRSRGVFCGKIHVAEHAQKTDAYQTNRNLLLSPTAKVDSIPNLEISADDVRCSHGSTTGQDTREELFYLMSRGLPRTEAQQLLVRGFFDDVLDRAERLKLPEPYVALVTELFSAKLGRLLN